MCHIHSTFVASSQNEVPFFHEEFPLTTALSPHIHPRRFFSQNINVFGAYKLEFGQRVFTVKSCISVLAVHYMRKRNTSNLNVEEEHTPIALGRQQIHSVCKFECLGFFGQENGDRGWRKLVTE